MSRFSKITEKLAIEMSDLTNSSKWLFVLLLAGITRKRFTNEPVQKKFALSYLDYEIFGLPRASYDLSLKELIKKKYIRVTGRQRSKQCELLKW